MKATAGNTILALYRNRFGNYIYAQTLNDGRGPKSIEDDSEMKLVRYNQSGADFYGAEGEIYFKRHRATVSAFPATMYEAV